MAENVYEKFQDHGLEDTVNFKHTILIDSQLSVYSRLTFSRKKKERNQEEKKTNLLCVGKPYNYKTTMQDHPG